MLRVIIAMPNERKSSDGVAGRYCTICDKEATPGERGFAVSQDRAEDRLSIFHCDEGASMGCVHYACSPAHVRELVVHWMVMGNLDYPFAELAPTLESILLGPRPSEKRNLPKLPVPIGELAVDRDAVQRILYENPVELETILEELRDALEKSIEDPLDTATLADLPEGLLPHI